MFFNYLRNLTIKPFFLAKVRIYGGTECLRDKKKDCRYSFNEKFYQGFDNLGFILEVLNPKFVRLFITSKYWKISN